MPPAAPIDPPALLLLYVVLPLWLIAGVADYACHRATGIAHTTGAKESALHLLMLAEIGIPLLAALFLEINALIFAVMIGAFLLHEATALWDVAYAFKHRMVTPVEQHVHSFLEILPLAALLLIATRHWPQFAALFGFGAEPPRFDLQRKIQPLPPVYIITILTAVVAIDLLPFLEELYRTLSANRWRLVPRRSL